MRSGYLLLASVLVLAGCAGPSAPKPAGDSNWRNTNASVLRPSSVLVGRIDSINLKAGYVIISFPFGSLPAVASRLDVYRQGLKVAELKVTPPQENNLTAADIVAGECRIGDEARSK